MKPNNDTPSIRFAGFTDAWEQRKAKDLCFISTGKSNTQDSIEDGTYPFYVRSPIVEKSNRYLFDEEAVLTVGDGVGTGKVFHYVNGKYDLHQRVYRMFGFTDDISAKFFYYFFSTHFYDRVMSMTAKTSVDSVRLEMIADMDIQYPKVREQKAISDFFDGLNYLITLHQREFTHTNPNTNYVKYYQRNRPLLCVLRSMDKSV
jgi:type I restriction enzyme S subunit